MATRHDVNSKTVDSYGITNEALAEPEASRSPFAGATLRSSVTEHLYSPEFSARVSTKYACGMTCQSVCSSAKHTVARAPPFTGILGDVAHFVWSNPPTWQQCLLYAKWQFANGEVNDNVSAPFGVSVKMHAGVCWIAMSKQQTLCYDAVVREQIGLSQLPLMWMKPTCDSFLFYCMFIILLGQMCSMFGWVSWAIVLKASSVAPFFPHNCAWKLKIQHLKPVSEKRLAACHLVSNGLLLFRPF